MCLYVSWDCLIPVLLQGWLMLVWPVVVLLEFVQLFAVPLESQQFQCQASFEMLKEALITSPILKYPDPNKAYTFFTAASKHAWACVLTQEYQHEKDGKVFKINHPITFGSGLFKGSQLNLAALTKESFAIYPSIKSFPTTWKM